MTQDASYASVGQITLDLIYCQRCVYTQPRKYKQLGTTEEAHYCMVLLLQEYGLEHVNICNLEF